MSEAPERIWAVTEPNDISADTLGDVYAQQVPDGMVGTPVEYIRADRIKELKAENAQLRAEIEAYKEMAPANKGVLRKRLAELKGVSREADEYARTKTRAAQVKGEKDE